jgi:uncharacterized lipoprotein YmbA
MPMKIPAPAFALMVAAALLAGCQSAAPIRYYTLLPAAGRDARPAQDPAFRIAVAAVAIPSQVDTPRIVIRESAGRLRPVETQRWIAPLADEVRAALGSALGHQLGVPDLGDATGDDAGKLPLIRVRVALHRFESVLGQQALIEAGWTIASGSDPARRASCDSRIDVRVGAGFDALAEGHQRALAMLAERIGRGIEALNAGRASSVCSAADGG